MYDKSNKKVRGSRRKCNCVMDKLKALTLNFPVDFQDKPYWHLHLPVAKDFVISKHTPNYVYKQITQALVDSAKHLSDIKPNDIEFCKVVLVLDFDNIFDSQIIVFFNEDYYNSFFTRDTIYQKWTMLEEECQRIKQWNIKLPDGFDVRGYLEEINDVDYKYIGKIWFIGEL